MVEQRVTRIALAVVLLAALALLFVDYSAHAADHDPYPTDEQIGTDYETYVGEPAYVWVDVVAVGTDSFEVENDNVELTVGAPPGRIKPGDVVQVYGTLEPGGVIDPERVVISKQDNRTYMFAVSALACLLTAGLFVREWTIDGRTLTIRPRGR